MQTRLFSPKAVCAATGIPPGTLATWTNRGHLKSFEAQAAGQGRARQFTHADALALALIKTVSDSGLDLAGLAHEAPRLARAWLDDPGPDRVLHAHTAPGSKSFAFAILHASAAQGRKPPAGLSISLSVDGILSAVTARLLSGESSDE